MIRPLLYDIRRTITSKTVLILIAVILLISLAIIPFTSPATASGGGSWHPGLFYYDGTGYHFFTYVSNQFGDPLSGVHFNVTLSPQGPGGGRAVVSGVNLTDSSGIGRLHLTAMGDYNAVMTVSMGGGSSSSGSSVYGGSPGKIQSFADSPISTAIDSSNSSRGDVQVFYVGDYGSIPSNVSVWVGYVNSSYYYCPKQFCFTESNMTSVQNMQNYHEEFSPTIPTGIVAQGSIMVGLFNQTGAPLVEQLIPLFELRPPAQPRATNVPFIASFFFSTILSFFVPLMVIIGSYSTYGKDRITGVLESILARPITRMGLALSRFLTTIISFSAAVIACVGVVDLLLFHYTGGALSSDYALAVMAGLVVETVAFTGLIFLLSHLVKSTGLLLGLSIVIFLILDFFWSIIIFAITFALGGTLGSEVAIRATINSYYANPAQFLSLINTFFFQSFSGVSIQTSNYGVTVPALIADGVLWATVPFALFLYLAIKRD